mgnify:CR=1 FL=1
MKKKIIALMLTGLFLVGCSAKHETPKQTVKNEEKNTKSNPALDEIDPIQKGDIKDEKDSTTEVVKSVNNSIKGFLKDVQTSQSPIGKSKNCKRNNDAKDATSYLLNKDKTDN